MRRDSWFLVLLVCVLIVLIFAKPEWGWNMQALISGSVNSGSDAEKMREIELQNTILKAEIAILRGTKNELPNQRLVSRAASVYSRYPFGFRNELLISIGRVEGIAIGEPVVIASDGTSSQNIVLVGSIVQVFEHTSVVKTVFDESWRSAVRIGQNGTDALLIGGPDPKLTLIAKNATTTGGESVYNTTPGFPYGAALGAVDAVSTAGDQLFKEATMKFPYDIGKTKTVLVITNYGTTQRP